MNHATKSRVRIAGAPTGKTFTAGDEIRPLRSAELSGQAVPSRVLLAPWGHVESTNGDFVVDDESAALAVRAFDEHGTDLPIDYEHQTLGGSYASPTGVAPAAGWIQRVFAEPGVGLLAEIEWTEQAKKMLAGKEYRYLSPVAVIRKADRKLVAIHSAALTNKPAIAGMAPIVNRDGQTAQPPEPQAADDRPAPTDALASLRTELALAADAEPETVLLAAGQRIANLEQQAKWRRVQERVQLAMGQGKLVEAQRAWAEALIAKEEGLFDEWLATAPTIVQTGAIAAPNAQSVKTRAEGVVARAKSEYRANPMLSRLTTEDAYVAAAQRQDAQRQNAA